MKREVFTLAIYIDKNGNRHYYNNYLIGNFGTVRSLNYRNKGIIKDLQHHLDIKNNYHYVTLSNGKHLTCQVHRLVLSSFNPNGYFKGAECNHKDENVNNNFVLVNDDGTIDLSKSNLEWVTRIYNMNYGTRNNKVKDKMINGKLSKIVLQNDKEGNFVKEWPSTAEIERQLGYYQQNISACCNGKLQTAYGFIWKYKETV